MGLPRKKYNLFMLCLGVYFDALEAIGTNFDLAYSMYVYLLEALSKGYAPAPTWSDYDPGVKARLETELDTIDTGTARNIKDILVMSTHLRLTKDFLDFVTDHVTDNFFTTEAEHIRHALPKSELRRVLMNLYKSRSGYVHSLKELEKELRHPTYNRCWSP
jgi:hypothetical protein